MGYGDLGRKEEESNDWKNNDKKKVYNINGRGKRRDR